MHKSEPAGIKVSWSSRNQDQCSLNANMAKSLGTTVLPNQVCSEGSGGKSTEGAQHNPSHCWAILSGLPAALPASMKNFIHPFPAGKLLLCISALSWLQSRHQTGCWKGFLKKKKICQRISTCEIHSCSVSLMPLLHSFQKPHNGIWV